MDDRYEDYGDDVGRPRRFSNIIDLILTVLATLCLVIFIRLFVAETFEIPSGSMLETIQLGDRLVGEKVSLHFQPPKYGDIVTFRDPDGSGDILIKRVIATAGQTVYFQQGNVYIDGNVLEEDYVDGKPTQPLFIHSNILPDNITYPYTVPEGCLWVMGDNRMNSLDSRYFGPITVDSVTSRAVFIYWPLENFEFLN